MNKETAIKGGVLGGISIIMFFLTSFALGKGMMMQMIVSLLYLAVIIVLPVVWVRQDRKEHVSETMGYPLLAAFKFLFVILFINTIISSSFNFIYMNVIDTDYASRVIESTLISTEEMMVNFGTPEDLLITTLEETEAGLIEQFSNEGMLKSSLYSVIGMAVLSLIISLFVWKKDPPLFGSEETDEVLDDNL